MIKVTDQKTPKVEDNSILIQKQYDAIPTPSGQLKSSVYYSWKGAWLKMFELFRSDVQAMINDSSPITSVLDTANIDLDVTSSTLSADLTNTTVIPNTYGDANNIPQITVDQKGRVTSVTDIPITIPPNYIDSISDTSTIDLTVTGTTLSADFASMNISQFTNDSGYITSSSITDIISPFLLMGA